MVVLVLTPHKEPISAYEWVHLHPYQKGKKKNISGDDVPTPRSGGCGNIKKKILESTQ